VGQFLLSFALISLYFSLVGPAASTSRAFLSLSLQFATVFLLRRSHSSLWILGVVAFFLLLINPFFLQNLGFQFSFLASFGILFLYRFLEKDLCILPNPVFKALALTVCAQFFLCPVFVWRFGEVSYLSVFSNLLILPLAELLTISFLCLSMALFSSEVLQWPLLIQLISLLIVKIVDILFWVIDFCEAIPLQSWRFDQQKELWTAFFASLNLAVIIGVQRYKARKYSLQQYRIFR
jgi:competence protein ComEC